MVELGEYEHYKGGRYEVIVNAIYESTEEPVVVYKVLYGNTMSEYWVRTESDFNSEVEFEGKTMPRFRKV
ncbi:MAG TPA: DUF1653 domain-containing protein [Candidatus Doudnabacteria bacterium]|nr:DUF1653 domain-containing protein [Candidatus Doudnabacteria bacterium]